MNLRWRDRDWLDADDPAGWWYVHKDAALLCLGSMLAVGFALGFFVAVLVLVVL